MLIALTSDYIWIILGCAGLGFGTAPLWPSVITGTTEVAGDEAKATVMSVVYMAWLSGVGLGPVVINLFIKGHDFRHAFQFMIGCMVVVVLVALLLPRKPQQSTSGNSRLSAEPGSRVNENKHQGTPPTDWRERAAMYFHEVKRSLKVSPLLFPAMFAQTFALGILTPILTLYAKEVLLLTSNQYSLFLIAGGAVTVLFLIPIGKLVDRVGIRSFLIAGFAISAASLLIFTYIRSMGLLYVVVAMLGVGYALIIPSWNALIASVIPPEKRGPFGDFF
ncbi:MFS transporter [Paenibacillus hexagrammi]|uniref:MFS transporter n=1 Tax=Paenibacillus hexagrammi TaxID=2908839 RepID=A0ABY3SMY1_9BACL|nr:MFS transporter [Paenibacillus sp. YPD9-1]UJF35222.1 MFS transporter [Paenibacillus sp. YPD9-1]